MKKCWIEDFWNRVESKLFRVAPLVKTPFPYTIDESGTYIPIKKKDGQVDVHWWTNGYWGGMMWLAYKESKKDI